MDQDDPSNNDGAQAPGPHEEEDMALNDEDVVEVLDADEGNYPEGQVADEIGDLDLDHYDDDEGDEAAGEEAQDDASMVYTGHSGSVFCVSVEPVGHTVAASGGEDDKAFVWDVNSGETLFTCSGHKDSVTCVAFSHDGSLLATGDMSGDIKVWSVATRTEVWTFQVGDLEWLEWHHAAPVLLAGTADGSMWMWKVPGGDCKTFQSFGAACSIGKVMPDGKRACVGYEDGSVRVWDLKATAPVQTFSGHLGHQGSITSMDCHHDNTVVITGSTDVTARLFNTTSNKLLGTLNCGSQDEGAEDSVEAVGFSRLQPFAATGTLQGSISVWDVPTQICRQRLQNEAGIVRLRWDHQAPLMYTCSLDGVVSMWDSRSGSREARWYGHNSGIMDMDLARDSSVIVTGAEDSTARVFTLQSLDR